MMIRIADLETRRKNILTAIIESFIDNPQPISSEFIVNKFDFGLSSASVRNVMADLEESGFITHPHTSAGRIPTNNGYRFYVDYLLNKKEIEREVKESINREFEGNNSGALNLLDKASSFLAKFLHYPSLISFSDNDNRIYFNGTSFIFEQPEFNDIKKLHSLFRILEERENLVKIINKDFEQPLKVYIGEENIMDGMKNCTMIISTYKKKNKPAGRIAVLGPTRIRYSYVIPLVEYTSCVISDFLGEFDE